MLNGADDLTDQGSNSDSTIVHKNASVYSAGNCLFAMFPAALRRAIVPRVVKYDSAFYNKIDANLKTANDKLWLFSPNELYTETYISQYDWADHPLEGSVYPKYADVDGYSTRAPYMVDDGSGSSCLAWLRSSSGHVNYSILGVGDRGEVEYESAYYVLGGVSPCFTLK